MIEKKRKRKKKRIKLSYPTDKIERNKYPRREAKIKGYFLSKLFKKKSAMKRQTDR